MAMMMREVTTRPSCSAMSGCLGLQGSKSCIETDPVVLAGDEAGPVGHGDRHHILQRVVVHPWPFHSRRRGRGRAGCIWIVDGSSRRGPRRRPRIRALRTPSAHHRKGARRSPPPGRASSTGGAVRPRRGSAGGLSANRACQAFPIGAGVGVTVAVVEPIEHGSRRRPAAPPLVIALGIHRRVRRQRRRRRTSAGEVLDDQVDPTPQLCGPGASAPPRA